DRADVDDAAPLALDHAVDHLLGDIEQAVQVGVDHRAPVVGRHLAEQAIARDARVVHQYIHGTQFARNVLEGDHGGIPVGNIAHRCIEGIALGGLLIQPLLIVAAGPAAGHDAKAVFGEPAADRRADTTHAA